MTIFSATTDFTGEVNVNPAIPRISCDDSYSDITASGYLSPLLTMGYTFNQGDFVAVYSTASNASGWYQVSFSSGVPTLSSFEANITGALTVAGAITSTTGNITSGSSGDAGTLISYPSTASKGTLIVAATNNTGNTNTTITNAAMGQETVVSIPDPGASSATFLLDHAQNVMAPGSSFVLYKNNGAESSNAITLNGCSGVITTSSLTTVGGASYAITWTNSFIASSSVVLLTVLGGTNSTKDIAIQVVPGAGSATLTITNCTAATALNGTVAIGYLVI